jgi:hypothetical protein
MKSTGRSGSPGGAAPGGREERDDRTWRRIPQSCFTSSRRSKTGAFLMWRNRFTKVCKGREPYFGLALERRLWLALRPSRGEPHRRGVRPIEASEAANRHVRLTSTRAAGFEQKRPPPDSLAYDSVFRAAPMMPKFTSQATDLGELANETQNDDWVTERRKAAATSGRPNALIVVRRVPT